MVTDAYRCYEGTTVSDRKGAMDSLGALSARFREFAERECHGASPLYEALCLGLAEDAELLEFMLDAPETQRRPNLILAVLHDLTLTGAPELAPYIIGGTSPEDRDPVPGMRELMMRNRSRIRAALNTHITQTNEPGRSAALIPALNTVAKQHGSLALLEVGASAGLNLLYDRYTYYYADTKLGADSGCVVPVEQLGAMPPVHEFPDVPWRVGLDTAPIDLRQPEQARWLLACVWPDHVERLHRLRAAISIAATDPAPPVLRHGGAIESVLRFGQDAPEDLHLCVWHSWAACYLDEDDQRLFTEQLLELSRIRPITWLTMERAPEVPALPLPPGPTTDSTVAMIELAGGEVVVSRLLADAHSHLQWLDWKA
ncbi:DUF2332 domain-containing protein [Pseudonocardiaceae bacterium YIM PH 21723]|nr:DUF2332 domain-containing protein [Pseudonocardiaceae bacterium YIM PH 21723]